MSVKAETKPLAGPLERSAGPGATVSVEPLNTGVLHAPREWLESKGGRLATLKMSGVGTPRSRWLELPVPAFLIRHPKAGPVLVDTGLHPSVAAKPSANLGRPIARFARPRIEPGHDLGAQLRERDVDPRKVETVVMTHLHFDHTSGVSEFPNATFVVSRVEWEAATTDSRPALRGYRPSHFDYLFDYRVVDFDSASIGSYASFGRTFDLFGDGSIRLAFTPGHSAGHCSVIARLRDRDLVIAGDAIYTYGQLEGALPPPRPLDMHLWQRSLGELKQFNRTYPEAVIIPGHDGEDWAQLEPRYE
jgi:glyoxylase-like metal-dependent hydrolase (beta-lactamase superfamily II)